MKRNNNGTGAKLETKEDEVLGSSFTFSMRVWNGSGVTLVCAALALALGACTGGSEKAELPKAAPPVNAAAGAERKGDAGAAGEAPAGDRPATQLAANGATGVGGEVRGESAPRIGGNGLSRVSGQIQSAKQGEQSFKVAGHISKTMANVGNAVKRGQVLAQLDDADYLLRDRISTVAVEQAKIAVEQSKRDMAREEQLRREGATTQANFERVTNQLENSQLALSQAQLNLQQVKKQLNDTRLVAAYDGVVSKRMKVEGEFVGVGAPVYQVSAVGELEVALRVPEALLRKVSPGQKVPLSIPSIEKTTEMEVQRIVPIVQENSRTFEVIGRVVTGDASIVPGQFVEAQF
jgi:RND family efflux transporter MFP subunit